MKHIRALIDRFLIIIFEMEHLPQTEDGLDRLQDGHVITNRKSGSM